MSTGMRIVAAIGGLLLLTQIVLLTIQLHTLKQSQAHIRSQDAKASRLYPLQKQTGRSALPLLREARGTIEPLSRRTGQIAAATTTLPELVSEAVPALRGTRDLVGAILGRDLVGTVERIAADARDSRRMLEESLALQRRSLDVQRQSLTIQRQTLVILQQSKGLQDETLVHARSIDNKTGGPVAANR